MDAMAAHLVRNPAEFDVVVTTNMYGDILSDLATELSGGLGLGGSLNHGENHAMAQAQHGSAPDIAGRGIANPASLIASSAMLFNWLGDRQDNRALQRAARAIECSLEQALDNIDECTPDLGGHGSTESFTHRVIEGLATAADA